MKNRVNRRDFLRISGVTVAAGVAGCEIAQPSGSEGPGLTDGAMPEDPQPDGGLSAPDATSPDSVQLADTGAPLPHSWPVSFSVTNTADTEFELKLLSGALPTDMSGHYFINGPVPQGAAAHPFNGDAILRRIDFGSSRVFYKQRVADTPCQIIDQKISERDGAQFLNFGLARMHIDLLGASLGVRNQVNTGFQPIMDDRLLITTDAGRPYEIDTESLEVVTPVGRVNEWRNGLFTETGIGEGVVPLPGIGQLSGITGPIIGPMMERFIFPAHFSSAHPVYDPNTREVFTNNINFVANDADDPSVRFTDLLRWDGHGDLERWTLEDEQGQNVKLKQSGHQIVITEKYVIIMDSAVNIELNRILTPDQPMQPQNPNSVLWIVHRAELKPKGGRVRAVKAVVPGEAGHFTADYENPNGLLTTYFTHLIATDLSEWAQASDVRFDNGKAVRKDLLGFLPAGNDINTVGKHLIDGNTGTLLDSRTVANDDYMWATLYHYHRGYMNPPQLESLYFASLGHYEELMLKRVAEAYRNHPHRRIPLEKLPNKDGRMSNLFHMNTRTMEMLDGYRLPPGRIMGSPVFVPREGSSGWTDGYVVTLVLSDDDSDPQSTGDEIWIFDARNLAQGPLARLGHPELNLSFTIHTTWIPKIGPRTAAYHVSASSDYQPRLEAAKASAEIRNLFRDHVYPRFG